MTLPVRATGLVNGKPRLSHPQGLKTADITVDMGDYIRDITPHMQNLVSLALCGAICIKLLTYF